MAQVIAVSEIHRVVTAGKAATATEKAVAPKTKIIAPGTTFISEGDELDSLRAAKAVRDPDAGEMASGKIARPFEDDGAGLSEVKTNGKPGRGKSKAATGENLV